MPRLATKLSVAAALVALTLSACSSSASKPSTSSTTQSGTSPSATASATASPSASPTTAGSATAAPVAGTQIVISKFLYAPENLMVKPGATVTVVNQDAVAHTVTATAAAGGIPFDTGTVNGGATGSFTAPTTPGTYPYGCTFHAQMHGTLTVSP